MNRGSITVERRNWQGLAYFTAKQLRIPRCESVALETWVEYGDRKHWLDLDGPAPTVKWCIDGLRQAGVVDDDCWPNILSLTYLPPRLRPETKLALPVFHLKVTAWPRPTG